jgi:nitrate reductase beta subunit
MIACILCQRSYSDEAFFEHLKTHTEQEIRLLKRLAEKEKTMTKEEIDEMYRNFAISMYLEELRLQGKLKEAKKKGWRRKPQPAWL